MLKVEVDLVLVVLEDIEQVVQYLLQVHKFIQSQLELVVLVVLVRKEITLEQTVHLQQYQEVVLQQ